MRIPKGKTYEQTFQAVQSSIDILANTFVFGCYTVEDIKQHAWIEALEILEKEKYDPERPLENFMFSHLQKRLINLKRNKFRRCDAPCRTCHDGYPCEEGRHCKRYAAWFKINRAKSCLMCFLSTERICEDKDNRMKFNSTVEDDVQLQELLSMVDEKLPVSMRSEYLQMREGVVVPKVRRLEIQRAVEEIVGLSSREEEP